MWVRCATLALSASLLVLGSGRAFAEDGGADIFSPDTVELFVDARVRAADGEASWLDDGFGKLRYGGDGAGNRSGLDASPEFAETSLVWKPRLSWALSGTVVGTVQNKGTLEAGLSEAYVSFKPLTEGETKFSARAGLMWPTISLEHGGGDWSVTETITPSAINSWIGEEVKVVGLEAKVSTAIGANRLELTGGLFDANDTSATLLSFRGWALHDVKAVAFKSQPLPPLNAFITTVQPRFTTPVLTVAAHEPDNRFGRKPGYYAKLALEPADLPLRIELFRYDNRADPDDYLMSMEWGWRTRFHNLGVVADLGSNTQFRAQGMTGRSEMGLSEGGTIWVDSHFRSAFGLVTQRFNWGSITGRAELFDTRNQGSQLKSDDDETGWAMTLAAKKAFNHFATGLVEVVHVESERDARTRAGLNPQQSQTQVQAALRLHW